MQWPDKIIFSNLDNTNAALLRMGDLINIYHLKTI